MSTHATARCPNCSARFRVARTFDGRRARCPKCREAFTLSLTDSTDEPRAGRTTPSAARDMSVASTTRPQAHVATVIEDEPRSGWWTTHRRELVRTAGAVILALALGYLVGREHLKHQIGSAMQDAFADAFTAGLAPDDDAPATASGAPVEARVASSSGTGPRPTGDTGETAEASRQAGPTATASQGSREAASSPMLELGETHRADGLALTLVGARVGIAQLLDMFGEQQQGATPDLILELKVQNTDARRILRFRGDRAFGPSLFTLRDDVDNVIRGVSYGAMAEVVGALSSSDDIMPGTAANHVELFSVPPPATEYLVLRVDLEAFGGDGDVRFRIPAGAIEGFAGR